jgi:competence protein ComEC
MLRSTNPYKVALALVLALFILLILASAASNAASGTVQASFINVGQGDSILLRDGNFDVLIDGGKSSAGTTVVAYLRAQGVDDLEVMLATHADADHIGGLIDVLQAADIPVESVLYNGYPGNTATWADFATAVANEGLTLTPAQYPAVYTWGAMTVHVLNPEAGLSSPEQNNASVVLLVQHGSVDFLFTGDIDSTQETTVVARGTPVAAEILKVAHHGSAYSSSDSFLAAVDPNEAVISVGSNPYGHPANETLSRLTAAGARIWRTDQSGTIVITSNGITYTVPLTMTEAVYLPLVLKQIPTTPPTPIPPTSTLSIIGSMSPLIFMGYVTTPPGCGLPTLPTHRITR